MMKSYVHHISSAKIRVPFGSAPPRPWIYTPIVGASFTEVHGSARRFARRAEEKVPHVAVAVLLRWLLR